MHSKIICWMSFSWSSHGQASMCFFLRHWADFGSLGNTLADHCWNRNHHVIIIYLTNETQTLEERSTARGGSADFPGSRVFLWTRHLFGTCSIGEAGLGKAQKRTPSGHSPRKSNHAKWPSATWSTTSVVSDQNSSPRTWCLWETHYLQRRHSHGECNGTVRNIMLWNIIKTLILDS